MSLCGLDIGTTGCKAVAFNDSGETVAASYREYPLLQPREGWVELDPGRIWKAVQETLQEAANRCSEDPISAIGVSSQGETTTAVDREGRALTNFIVTFDDRTDEQVAFWESELGRLRLFEITGMPLHPMYSINKIMWIRSNLATISAKIAKFVLVEDFVINRLCGEYAIDFTLASRTMAFDVTGKQWSSEMLDRAGIDRTMLSATCPSGTKVGTVHLALAEQLGLSRDTAVVTGGHDQPCGALGAGVSRSNVAMNATGTVDALCPVFDRSPDTDSMLAANFPFYPFVIEGYSCTIGFNLTGGLLLKWYRDVLGREEVEEAKRAGRDVYDIIFGKVAPQPKDLYVLPYLVGSGTPALDPSAKGAIVGMKLSTTKEDIIRGLVDGINLDMRNNIERMNEIGIHLDEIRAVGGGAKSRRWLQMKADCFGIPVRKTHSSEAVALGAAILAGSATAVFASIEEGVDRMVSIDEEFEPNETLAELYDEKFEKYRELIRVLAGYNHTLSESN